MVDKRNTWRNLDWVMVSCYMALVLIGWLTIYSAGYDYANLRTGFFKQVYGKQLIWISVSSIVALAILITDNKFFTAFAYYIYGALIVALVAAIVIGQNIKGSHSWINLGFFQFQPAEFSKFATCLALSKYMSGLNMNFKNWKTWAVVIAIFLFPTAIIVLQNETGSALVYFVFFLVIYRFGFPGIILVIGLFVAVLTILSLVVNEYYLILSLFIVAGIATYFAWKQRKAIITIATIFVVSSLFVLATDYFFNHILEAHQRQRIDVFLGREVKVKDADYNVRQSKVAIGSGGFLGKGYMHGTLTKYNFVPEQTTDFIFCTIGEEEGFWGSLALLLIYLGFMSRILFIAERQRSKFSRIYAYGVACILFFHIIINVGMTMGLMPVIGIPLPLVSYGGSEMLSFTILIFILIKLDADRLSVLR